MKIEAESKFNVGDWVMVSSGEIRQVERVVYSKRLPAEKEYDGFRYMMKLTSSWWAESDLKRVTVTI